MGKARPFITSGLVTVYVNPVDGDAHRQKLTWYCPPETVNNHLLRPLIHRQTCSQLPQRLTAIFITPPPPPPLHPKSHPYPQLPHQPAVLTPFICNPHHPLTTGVAHGLSTYTRLAGDVLTPGFSATVGEGGSIVDVLACQEFLDRIAGPTEELN